MPPQVIEAEAPSEQWRYSRYYVMEGVGGFVSPYTWTYLPHALRHARSHGLRVVEFVYLDGEPSGGGVIADYTEWHDE